MLALGVAVVLIEVGFLWMYRSGWTLATGALMVNVLATLAPAAVGVLVFGERLHWPRSPARRSASSGSGS